MIRRWGVYLAVLAGCLGMYAALPSWATWIIALTAAGTPLVSVAISAFWGETDVLGLFRFPGKRKLEYDQRLRPYRPGDAPSRVHWKRKAKSGEWLVREECAFTLPAKRKINPILPAALCFVVLFCFCPPGRYARQMQLFQKIFSREAQVKLDLTTAPQERSKQPILDVVASESQLLYLRGQSFEVYDGTFWQAAEQENWSVWEPVGTVTAVARTAPEVRLAPYDGAPPKDCLQLPKDTKKWAESLAAGKTPEQIQTFVRSCANYDENAVAAEETARWLVENGRGYCVHFATTAAVLLRAAGIPARLVTGHTVQVQAGLRKTVTGENAHAWVEYWDGESWHILEATPTVEAGPVLPVKKENRRSGGWGLILAALAVQELGFRKYKKLRRNPRIRQLKQKAAFSRDGLSEAEREEYKVLMETRPRLPL